MIMELFPPFGLPAMYYGEFFVCKSKLSTSSKTQSEAVPRINDVIV